MSFALQVGKWTKDTVDGTARLHKATIFELFTSVILDTPVLEGRLRGNWIMSYNSASSGTVTVAKTQTGSESKNSDKFRSGRKGSRRNASLRGAVEGQVTSKVVNEVFSRLASFPKGKDFTVYLTNNLPYASRIEFGYSKVKAPEGMVRKNIIRITQNLQDELS
jgi:hypothetical protein